MKCILLAAGYATRLYPLTLNKPKSLLEVGGITILEHIISQIRLVPAIDEIILVTNARFAEQFAEWLLAWQVREGGAGTDCGHPRIKIINDHTTSNEDRLGAIGDLAFVIAQEQVEDELLVMAGDNLFDFDLRDFVNFYEAVGHNSICVHRMDDLAGLQRTGVVEVDEQDRVISFEEKPVQPKSNLAVPPFYIYTRETLPLIQTYLDAGHNPDAPGHLIPWVLAHKDMYAYRFKGQRYDIGTPESYKAAQELFGGGR